MPRFQNVHIPFRWLAITLALAAMYAVFITCLLPANADAACVPDPIASYCNTSVIDNDACPVGATELVWCPAGDLSLITATIGIIDIGGTPCANCPVTVDFRFAGTPKLPATNLWVCGTVNGMVQLTGITNALGEVTFTFTGGGCGCLLMDFNAQAAGIIVCQNQTQFCVKSPDITGDGTVNFFDTFKFLPMLNAGLGTCSDFNCSGTVNFFDVFQYLPHLGGGHTCAGSAVPFVPCPNPALCP